MSQPPQLAPAQSTADPIPATDGTPLVSLGPPVAPDILHQAGAIAEEFGRAGVSLTAVEAGLSRRRSRRRVIQFYSALAIIYIAVFGVGFGWVAWWNVVGKPIPEWAEMSWSQWLILAGAFGYAIWIGRAITRSFRKFGLYPMDLFPDLVNDLARAWSQEKNTGSVAGMHLVDELGNLVGQFVRGGLRWNSSVLRAQREIADRVQLALVAAATTDEGLAFWCDDARARYLNRLARTAELIVVGRPDLVVSFWHAATAQVDAERMAELAHSREANRRRAIGIVVTIVVCLVSAAIFATVHDQATAVTIVVAVVTIAGIVAPFVSGKLSS
ncbi:MAG TPA: hypothetical protein VIJ00_09090 [Nakamurella sp.]